MRNRFKITVEKIDNDKIDKKYSIELKQDSTLNDYVDLIKKVLSFISVSEKLIKVIINKSKRKK